MTVAALQRFNEARSERSGRASARPAAAAGLAACVELSGILDEAILAAAEDAIGRPSENWEFALVAVGGYGRREQCRHSDIDLMLLTPRGGEADASQVLYPLWDAGLKLGHSVRTVAQATQAGSENVETLTALLDARCVGGDADLFADFLRARRRLVRRKRGWFRDELRGKRAEAAAEEPWELQAPNVKSGRGGLREVQLVHWLAAAEAVAADQPPPPLAPQVEAARERLLATRNALHALEERPNDIFRDDLRVPVAEWLSVDPDEWSRDLSLARREVDAAASAVLEAAPRRWWRSWRRGAADAAPAADVEPSTDLERLLAAVRGLAEAEHAEGSPPLDLLPRSEWLDRVAPEWEVLRGRRHVAPYHLHPFDTHSLRSVAEAARIAGGDDEGTAAAEAAATLPLDEILLAALLHDIGKGHGGDHSEVGTVITERFASRVGLDAALTARLAAVTAHHLLLPTVATRRDIADERVLREVAETVGDARTLRLLYVVSVADARASGPDVWNPWKAQLMRGLYLRVADMLAEGDEAADLTAARVDAVVRALAGRFGEQAVRGHLDALEPGYLLGSTTEEIGGHLELIAAAEGEPHRSAVRRDRHAGVDRLTVVSPDRPGLLQAIAGTLAAHNASVLGGVAYTRDDGIAIQVWHVGDALGVGIDDRRWGRILEAAPAALADDYPIDDRIAEVRARYGSGAPERVEVPTSVSVDNAGSDDYSIVEVSTADRRGLLYAITHELHEMGIDIHLAKVDTIGAEVVDAFYVRRENGRRVEEADEIERLERRLSATVEALDEDE